jgi:hypothetical protein
LDLTYYPLQKKENSEKMNGVVIVTFHNQDVCGVFFVFAVLGFELSVMDLILSCKRGIVRRIMVQAYPGKNMRPY